MAERSSDGGGWFPTTNWSLVGHAGDELDQQQRLALDRLLKDYWSALKAHLVYRRRVDPNDADDLVQGFIENKVLERNLLGSADQDRGRFRGLLVTALDNYATNVHQRGSAKKRSADRAVRVDPKDGERWAAADCPPDKVFDVAWARQVLEQAVDRMREECQSTSREDLWGVFEGRILAPMRDGADEMSYDALVRQFGFRSPAQASNALITAKRMFARLLKEVIGQYAVDQSDLESEIRELGRCLAYGT